MRYLPSNPATNELTVNYNFEQGDGAALMLLNNSATQQQSYPISSGTNNMSIDISALNSGSYSVILLVDGIAVDNQTLIIQ